MWLAPLLRLRQRRECETLRTCRAVETVVKCGERDSLRRLALEVQTAGELDSISGAQGVPEMQLLSVKRQFWSQFYQEIGREIGVEPPDGAITLGCREGTFAFATCER